MKFQLTRQQVDALNPRDFTFTSASFGVFEACPAACVFNGPKREPTGGQWYGIFVHRFLEYVTSKGPDHALAYIRSKASTGRSAKAAAACCEKIDLDAIPVGEAEVGLAHDLERGHVRRVFGRHDRAGKYEAFGKADLVFDDRGSDHVHVADYKCGWLDGNPYESTQLLGLACALRVERGVPEVKASLVGVENTGALHWNTGTFDGPRLDDFESRMRRVHLRMLEDRSAFRERGISPEFLPGPHCNSCWCQTVCPAVPPSTVR